MRTTNDLMNELTHEVTDERSLNEYLERIDKYSGVSFADYFKLLMDRHKVSKSDVIKNSLIERTFASKMLSKSENAKRPTRNHLIALCISCNCSVAETEKCLSLSGNSAFYSKDSRDSIIIYGINRGLSVMEINELLFENGHELLVTQK